jgi:hypothetical protein
VGEKEIIKNMTDFPYLDLWTAPNVIEEKSPEELLRQELLQKYPILSEIHTNKFPVLNVSLAKLKAIDKIVKYPSQNNELSTAAKKQLKRDVEAILAKFGYSPEMDYETFAVDYQRNLSPDEAFYYYMIDKSIPRRDGVRYDLPMDRLNFFYKAYKREHKCKQNIWHTLDQTYSFEFSFNTESGEHSKLAPGFGQNEPDFVVTIFDSTGKNLGTVKAEEKPAYGEPTREDIAKYKSPKSRYNAQYVVFTSNYNDNTIYWVDYTNKTVDQLVKQLAENKKSKFKIC